MRKVTKKWLMIDTGHCLRIKKLKKGSMVEIHIKISLKKKKQIIKRYGNNTHKISLKKTNNKRSNP